MAASYEVGDDSKLFSDVKVRVRVRARVRVRVRVRVSNIKDRDSYVYPYQDTYASSAAKSVLDIQGSGPIATAFRSAARLDVEDTSTYPFTDPNRRELCMEWGVGKITAIPMETGVLEFGKVNPTPSP